MYARAGIVEVWLVDLEARVIIVHREPQADRYRDARTARLGDEITLSALPDVTIAVTDVLGQ
ncbi:MAG: Uma2 family endonuclease [Egibacteraceae bacterium]